MILKFKKSNCDDYIASESINSSAKFYIKHLSDFMHLEKTKIVIPKIIMYLYFNEILLTTSCVGAKPHIIYQNLRIEEFKSPVDKKGF